MSGQFGTGAEMSYGHFGTSAEMSWVRSVLGPKCLDTAKVPGSEKARERKGQGAKGPRSELARERIGQGPIGRFAPGSELARERKGSVPNNEYTIETISLLRKSPSKSSVECYVHPSIRLQILNV